ncbi:hypothetical protein D3C77_587150 [compost metagenome]
MHRPRRLVPELTRLVGDRLGLTLELGHHRPFEHIGHDRPRMLVRHGLLARCVADREHDRLFARRIARQLFLQNLDRFLALLRTMRPGTRQGKQASNDQRADG